MRWFASTVVRTICAGLAGLILCPLVYAGTAADAKSTASSMGSTFSTKYGTKDTFKTNLAAPMTTTGASMNTVDGGKSFVAATSAPSSINFLQVFIQPGATGDLPTVIVSQDLDTNGTYDNTFTLGVPVSGVCADGFISCEEGTWNNCQPYKWVSDSDGKVSVTPVGITSLKGCYCINTSCGSSLVWTNRDIVLNSLGAGVVSAIQSTDASVTITNVTTSELSIYYYGQIVKKASTPSSNTGTSSTDALQTYYTDKTGASLTAANASYLATAANPDSSYYMIRYSQANKDQNSQLNTCTVERKGWLSSNVEASFSNTGTSGICVDHLLFMMIEKVNDTTYNLKLVGTGPGGLGQIGHNCGGAGWQTQHTISLPAETGKYQAKLTKALYNIYNFSGGGCNSGGSASIDGITSGFNTAVMATAPCPAPGAQAPSFNWSYLFEFATDTYGEEVTNNCSSYESDSTCKLQAESVDSVTTVRAFSKTGLNPIPSCKTYTGVVQDMKICRPWWSQKRTYACTKASGFDLSAMKNRFNSVVTSSNDGGTVLTYTDLRQQKDGSWVNAAGSINLNERDTYSDCEKACQVRKTLVDTQVGVTGVMSLNRTTSNSYVDLYKVCTDGGTTCPVGENETIISNCACTNQFSKVSSIFQTLRLAGEDSICSSGTLVNQ